MNPYRDLVVAWVAENPSDGVSRPGLFAACLMIGEEVQDSATGLELEDALAWGRSRASVVMVRTAAEGRYFSAGAEKPPWGEEPQWPPDEHEARPSEGIAAGEENDGWTRVSSLGPEWTWSQRPPRRRDQRPVPDGGELTSWLVPHPPWDDDAYAAP